MLRKNTPPTTEGRGERLLRESLIFSPSKGESGGPRIVACQWKASSPTGPDQTANSREHITSSQTLNFAAQNFLSRIMTVNFPAEHWAGGSFMMSFNSLFIRF